MRTVLILPRWYPDKTDLQQGIFIRKHALAISKYNKVIVLAVAPDPTPTTQFRAEEHRVGNLHEIIIYYAPSLYPGAFIRRVKNFLRYSKAFTLGFGKLNSIHFDLIHVNVMTKPALFAYRLKLLKKIPYVVTEHWSGYVDGKFNAQNPIKRWLSKFLLKQSNGISVISGPLKESIEKIISNTVVIEIIPNIIDYNKFTVKKVDNPFVFLVVADMDDKVKNISGVIEAFGKLNLPDTELHIIGGGNDFELLKKKAEQTNNKTIQLLGRKTNEEVLSYFENVHCTVVNSRYETFSVVTAESLVSGIPVIATKCGGPEQFITKENGILVNVNDNEVLMKAMKTMIEQYASFSTEESKKQIISIYSSEKMGKQFTDWYAKCLKK